MKYLVVVQARCSSSRLPKKILRPINGKPLLLYLCEKIRENKILKDHLVIATSIELSDNLVEQFCVEHNIKCFRGDLNNVASRFKNIIEQHQLDAVIRLCGDSPLLDSQIIENALQIFKDNNFDLVTNVLKRTFPKGQSVEVIKAETFLNCYQEFENKSEYLEHVTKYFYEYSKKFNIYNIESPIDFGAIQLSVDLESDFDLVENIILKMSKPHWEYSWKDIIKLREDAL